MQTLTTKTTDNAVLSELDAKIGCIRQALQNSEASDCARYQLEELLAIRRKLVLGQFQVTQ
jgi:hypothetical protein